MAPAFEPEPEVTKELGETELSAAKTVVANVLEQSAGQISNVSKITEAADLLIKSSISEDHKAIWPNFKINFLSLFPLLNHQQRPRK